MYYLSLRIIDGLLFLVEFFNGKNFNILCKICFRNLVVNAQY